jgi:CDK-activating kinase assembly factor MAT1
MYMLKSNLKRCESCIQRLFLQGPAPCPICKTILRKQNFTIQTFEDLFVEKELQIRHKVQKFFNKRPEDFKSLREYNDYLEQVEDIMFNLINNVNVQETQEKIDKFRQENKDIIQKNLSKQHKEDRLFNIQLEKEKKEKMLRKEALLKQAQEQEELKQQRKEKIIHELATAESDEKAKEILEAEKSKVVVPTSAIQYVQLDMDSIMDHDEFEEYDEYLEEMEQDEFMDANKSYQVQPNYVDPWTAAIKSSEKALVARAGGYLPRILYEKALYAAFKDLLI